MHNVYVEYDGGLNSATDNRIFEAANYEFGKGECDSGCELSGNQTRDLSFYYDSTSSALEAKRKLEEIPDIRVRVELEN